MARTHDCGVQREPAVKPLDDDLKHAVVLREGTSRTCSRS
jgi:hypothetical protein